MASSQAFKLQVRTPGGDNDRGGSIDGAVIVSFKMGDEEPVDIMRARWHYYTCSSLEQAQELYTVWPQVGARRPTVDGNHLSQMCEDIGISLDHIQIEADGEYRISPHQARALVGVYQDGQIKVFRKTGGSRPSNLINAEWQLFGFYSFEQADALYKSWPGMLGNRDILNKKEFAKVLKDVGIDPTAILGDTKSKAAAKDEDDSK